MSGLKDAARLLGYFVATAIVGALIAPWLFWGASYLAAHGILRSLARYDFESFFHRALLIAALVFAWPLLASLKFRRRDDFGLRPNAKWLSDVVAGVALAAVPLLCASAVLLASGLWAPKQRGMWHGFGAVVIATCVVPLIEETLFRGFIFAVLSRLGERVAAALSSGLFAILHFLKAPPGTSTNPKWYSGFVSIAHAFDQFRDPMLVLASFCTLFLIGCVLVHARMLTKSLWLSIGLHAGWILLAGAFAKFAMRLFTSLPWIGNTLMVGVVPLITVGLTWALMLLWFRYVRARAA